jgi:hypothetical protein
MNKKPLKKMFVMKETLVDLTPHLSRVQGAVDCTTITNWQLSDVGSCGFCIYDNETKIRTVFFD